MPSTSKKQHNFMEAVAHNPSFAKKAGVPQSVGKDFSKADKGKTFKEGGSMASKMNPGFMAMMAKKKAGASKMGMFEKSGKDVEKKGMKEGSKAEMAMDKKQMMGMKKGGPAAKKMATGGLAAGHKSANGIAAKGKTKGKQISMPGNKGMKSGGMAKKYC
jgi:hypothetical protein